MALWNGNDTSLSTPTTTQYMGVIAQIVAGGLTTTIGETASIVDGIKSAVAQMVASNGFHVRPTAIYANPVLLDLIDREMKTEFNVVLNTDNITGGIRVKMLSTQAGDLPLIPDWSLSYSGTPGSGSAVLPAYIVTEDLIEYHWLGDPTPRIFQLGLPNSMTYQYVAVKFGAPVVSPVVMRKLRPTWQEGGESKWELFVSATGVEQQVNALDLASAQSLFAMTLAVTVAGQDYLIESIASNEAFGQVYLYRLLLREARQQAV